MTRPAPTACLAAPTIIMLTDLGPCTSLGLYTFSLGGLLILAGTVLVTLGLVAHLHRRQQQRIKALTPQEKIERTRQLHGMRGDLEDLMAQIEELAKRFDAQLEAQTLELERLIEEADRRIAPLSRMVKTPGAGSEPGLTRQPDPQHDPRVGADDPLAKSVYELADKGIDATDIASQLNEHIGKVELILALRSA